MAALRTTLFWQGQPAAGTTLVYTVPAGKVAVLRAVHWANQGASAKIGGVNLSTTVRILTATVQATGAAGSTADWGGLIVMGPDQDLYVVQQTGGAIFFILSGSIYFI